jgi:hypothetical protein
VVDGELGGGHGLPAVLAGVVVPQEQVSPVGAQHPAWDLDVGQQADDDDILTQAPASHCLLHQLPGKIVHEGDPLLGQQDDQTPLANNIQRLK